MNSESNHDPANAQHSDAWIAALACLLFLLSLWGAWNASRQTEYLPIHDVLSYTEKAGNIWSEIWRGNFRGLHGVEQTIRPFGTSLLGYPLGYNEDFRAYYWRTVAFPACFCAIGAFFAALAAGASWRTPSAWLLACFGGMLPMWWSFDPVESATLVKKISYWGMMDGMQAGMAALAAGLLIYGWRRNIYKATFLSFFLSAFTLLLKPVGVFLIAGHCLAGLALLIWTHFREPSRTFRRFAWGWFFGIGWCALICGWCYFSPYFSAANQEMGRQALEQLKALSSKAITQQIFLNIIPSLGIYALGFFTLGFWIAGLACFQKISKQIVWGPFVALLAGVVLVLQLAVLYHGTRFQTSRYFLPALAIFWIFLSPFLWLLLEKFRWARCFVLANALILTASVWSKNFSNAYNQLTGYPTFLSQSAVHFATLAKRSIENTPQMKWEPIIYVLTTDSSSHILLAHQLAKAVDCKENVVWKYGPRLWEKHAPAIHPHEIACADFLVVNLALPKSQRKSEIFVPTRVALQTLQSLESLTLAPVLASDNEVSVRTISDTPALEKMLAANLEKSGLLHPAESGAILETTSGTIPLATFESGDELVSANADWVGDKLRVMATWSGSRDLKRHLQVNVALVDSQGIPIHWIPLSLVAAPTSEDGSRYRRTIVEELDCGPFRNKTASIALGIYDLSLKSMVRPVSSKNKVVGDRILQTIGTNSRIQQPQSP